MRTQDHLLLGNTIADMHGTLSASHRKALVIGCVEPDYNILTYMRGSIKFKNFYGHNTENLKAHITACMSKLKKFETMSLYECFRLGTLLHYVSDSFTYPHTPQFSGSMSEHIAYENIFHDFFVQKLEGIRNKFSSSASFDSWDESQKSYIDLPPSMEKDSLYIIDTCVGIAKQFIPYFRSSKKLTVAESM